MASDGMADSHSVIANDTDKFSSLLSNVTWRPTNLSSLGNANLGLTSVKQDAFVGTIVVAVVYTYLVGSGQFPGDVGTIWKYLGYFVAALLAINFPTFKKRSAASEHRARCESEFKFVHSRIRLHAETVALYAAEDVERAEVSRSFNAVVKSTKTFIAWQSLFQSLQAVFQFAPFLVSGAPTKSASSSLDSHTHRIVCSIRCKAIYLGPFI